MPISQKFRHAPGTSGDASHSASQSSTLPKLAGVCVCASLPKIVGALGRQYLAPCGGPFCG